MRVDGLRFQPRASIMPYMNEAFHLARLQKIDSQIDQIHQRLAEIQNTLDRDQEVLLAQSAHSEAEKGMRAARQALRSAEEQVEGQRMKIELNQAALYGGRVRNPKELQDLQNESASLTKHMAALEDKQLDAMLALEEAEQTATSAARALEQAQGAFATRSAALLGEQSRLRKDLERLQAERDPAASQVSTNTLDIYTSLRKKKSGIAVAGIEDSCCTACGSELPPMEWQAARSPNKVAYCTNCGRILYAG